MRRRSMLAAALWPLAAAQADDAALSGIWFAEYGDRSTWIQQIDQRLEGGTWRAEIRIFVECRESERFMAQGNWRLDGVVLVHIMRRRGNWLVSPQTYEYRVLGMGGDAMRLRARNGSEIESRRVARSFRFPNPSCGAEQRV